MLKRIEQVELGAIQDPEDTTIVDSEITIGEMMDLDGKIEEESVEGTSSWLDSETKSFLVSMFIHLTLIVGLASYTVVTQPEILRVLIDSSPIAEEQLPIDVLNEIAYSDAPTEEIGANSVGQADMALSTATVLADISEIPAIPVDVSIPNGDFTVSVDIKTAVGITEAPNAVKGMTGVGETGTDGAVDRITYELLQAIEQRPTLVVWLFDSSVSMMKRREEIRDRFERIYRELGIVQEEKKKRSTGMDQSQVL